MSRLTKDPLIRRFISTCLFAAAFVWVAMEFFGVDSDVVWRFLIGSILMVVVVIGLAWLFALVLVRFRRRRGSFLDDIEPGDNRRQDD